MMLRLTSIEMIISCGRTHSALSRDALICKMNIVLLVNLFSFVDELLAEYFDNILSFILLIKSMILMMLKV